MSSLAAIALTDCPNCAAPLHGRFCAECGQKVAPVDPTLHDVVHDALHEFAHLDGLIFQSIRLLYTRPGLLTREYCEGRRARHASPFRLYLTFSLIYFAALTFAPAPPIELQKDKPTVGVSRSVRSDRPFGITISGDANVSAEELGKRAREAEHDWLPKALFLLVPVCAVLVKLVTRRTHRRFPQHLYFALHAHAFYFGIAAFTVLLGMLRVGGLERWFSPLRAALTCIYLTVAFRAVYGGGWIRSTIRSAGLMLSYMLIVVMVLIGIYISALRPYT